MRVLDVDGDDHETDALVNAVGKARDANVYPILLNFYGKCSCYVEGKGSL